MIKNIKRFFEVILYYISTFFTFFIVVEIIIKLLNKEDSIRIYSLLSIFIAATMVSIMCYIIWDTNLLQKYSYRIKSIIQYILGLVLIYSFNSFNNIGKILFIFIYYNILYFCLRVIFIYRQRRQVDRLNKIIMKLKENKDE